MIPKSWNTLTLICGNHGDDYSHQMEIFEWSDSKRDAVFYRCPQYQARYGTVSGPFCNNRLTIEDYMNLLTYLQDQALEGFEETNLTGLQWTKKGIHYKVLNDNNGKYTVAVVNQKAISK